MIKVNDIDCYDDFINYSYSKNKLSLNLFNKKYIDPVLEINIDFTKLTSKTYIKGTLSKVNLPQLHKYMIHKFDGEDYYYNKNPRQTIYDAVSINEINKCFKKIK